MLPAIVAAILVILSNILLLFFIKNRIIRTLKLYLEAPNADTPSQLALFSNDIAQQFASNLLQGLKMTELGLKRGSQKQEEAVQAAIVTDLATAKSPMLGMALKAFPNLATLAGKNKEIANLAMAALQGMNKGGSDQGNTGGGNGGYDNPLDINQF